MKTFSLLYAAVSLLAAVPAAADTTLSAPYARAVAAVQLAAEQPQTRIRSEFTKNQVPLRVGECSAPSFYKDAIERPRVKMTLESESCREKVAFTERAEGTEGRGIFKRTKWVRVPGSEKTSHERALDAEEFDLSYEPDSFRTREAILRDLKDSCEARRRELVKKQGPSACR